MQLGTISFLHSCSQEAIIYIYIAYEYIYIYICISRPRFIILYHLEKRWCNSDVLVYHGPVLFATFWEWLTIYFHCGVIFHFLNIFPAGRWLFQYDNVIYTYDIYIYVYIYISVYILKINTWNLNLENVFLMKTFHLEKLHAGKKPQVSSALLAMEIVSFVPSHKVQSSFTR